MSASDSLEQQILWLLFSATAYTPEATWFIGLSSTDPGETGSTQNEPVGGNYGRVAKTNNTTNFPNAIPVVNGTEVLFPVPSANWVGGVNLGWVTLWNHATNTAAANFKGSGQLTTPQPAMSGNTIRFPAGQLVFSLT